MRVLPLLLAGCLNLDGFVYNPVHCTRVGPDTCDNNVWDRVCVPCEEEYDWTRDYPFADFAPAPALRPVPDGGVERLSIPSADGEAVFDAYWLPSHGGDPALANTTILYNHGNYASVEHYQPRARVLWELGYNVLIWDYRGYGKTEPATTPTAAQFMDDARQLRAHVATLAPDPSRVILYGYSLGALPSVEGALADPPCALLLEAPFTSTQAIARSNATTRFPESFLSEGRFDNIRKIADYQGPLLGMVGTDDQFFAADDVARLVEASGGPSELWLLDGVQHGVSTGGVVEAGIEAYRDRIRGFLDATAPTCLGAP